MNIGTERIAAIEFGDREIVRVDVFTAFDILRGEADDLAVPAYGVTRSNRLNCYFVRRWNILAGECVRRAYLRADRKRVARDTNYRVLMQPNYVRCLLSMVVILCGYA